MRDRDIVDQRRSTEIMDTVMEFCKGILLGTVTVFLVSPVCSAPTNPPSG